MPVATGPDANGTTPGSPFEPVAVAGWDGTTLRALKTDSSGNLEVNASAGGSTYVGSPTDASTLTITTGGTAQVLFAANPTRHGWRLQNTYSKALYWSDSTTATTAMNALQPGAEYESSAFVSSSAISIIGADTGATFYATQW